MLLLVGFRFWGWKYCLHSDKSIKIECLNNRVVGTAIVWKTNYARNPKYDYKMGNDYKVEFQKIKKTMHIKLRFTD